MKRFLFLFVLALFVSPAAQAEETAYNRVMKTKTIRCGYFVWPPFMMKDANTKKLSGLNYDTMEAVAKNLNLKLDWAVEIGVAEVVAALNGGKFDALCVSVWPSQALMQNVSLSNATAYSVVYAFVRKDDKRFDGDLSKANRKDIKVSGIDGDITAEIAREKLPDATFAFLPQMASGSEILLQLITKKADIALVDQALVNDFLKTNPGTIRKVENIPPVRFYGEHLAVKRGEYHLRDMLNLAINQLTNDGVLDDLARRYAKEYDSIIKPPAPTFLE